VQVAFRGVLACHGPGNPSLPGKARGFRGQDTVERHGSFGVVMEKIVQWEQENPASNGREMIDALAKRFQRLLQDGVEIGTIPDTRFRGA